MSARNPDILIGLAILALAAAWCWGVVDTVPAGDEFRLGPRGFPLGLGVLLGILGAAIALQGMARRGGDPLPEQDADRPVDGKSELWAVCSTVGLLVAYAALMQHFGFLAATIALVAIAVGLVLRERRPALLCGMSLGIGFVLHLVFGKMLGVYLPVGSLFNLAF